MTDDDSENAPALGVSEIRIATKRALVFQRYIFKKAWGIYYAIWAAVFSIYFFLPALLGALGLSSNLGNDYFLLIIDLAVSVAAGAASGRIIERARSASFVHSTLRRNRNTPTLFERRKKLFAVWWTIYFAVIIGAAVFFSAHLLSIVFGLATTVTLVFYYALRASFQERLPLEGTIAISTFGLASTVSFAVSLLNANPILYGVIWGITIVIWLASSLYSLLYADEELTESEVLIR